MKNRLLSVSQLVQQFIFPLVCFSACSAVYFSTCLFLCISNILCVQLSVSLLVQHFIFPLICFSACLAFYVATCLFLCLLSILFFHLAVSLRVQQSTVYLSVSLLVQQSNCLLISVISYLICIGPPSPPSLPSEV